ncbi:H-NS histone family protein [Micromonospora sp. 4G55]|uniref:H-NS histone family protein n=1 Tax=Micromonospora sp. 4G55 TaxID=2806102 RepID=UPI001A3E8FCC|nr:H-NS histone family protein [Micromonospora sp. 4G55]MBM0258961.1 hypothetical protein [Micromonospora sp. 4G55]
MTDPHPAVSADWHAHQAETLVALARSEAMSGWLKRGQRREILGAAQTHATLGAAAVRLGEPASITANVKLVTEQLANTEAQREAATVRARQLEDELEQIRRTLANYGVDVGDVLDLAHAVERLLEDRYANAEPPQHA